ncbi:hypothetical protein L2E82_16791 [Cichorium intybus]|uniref:Uncharacterized protein n=1 Tax=Cichorium intybus TaxID=13427 RepID=A0ACB9F7R9_CICIN|nr:hypothetical protein L2E82_16791 [Cichorium intybus]
MITALKNAIDPIPVNSGSVAIVKPTDEELFAPNNPKGFTGKLLGQPGLKQSVRVCETGFREVAAYDYDASDHGASSTYKGRAKHDPARPTEVFGEQNCKSNCTDSFDVSNYKDYIQLRCSSYSMVLNIFGGRPLKME